MGSFLEACHRRPHRPFARQCARQRAPGIGNAAAARHASLSHSALCRLCRLYSHGAWTGPNARFQAATQLQPTVYFNVYGRTLAPLAYLIVSVGARLCVHSTECFAALMASLGHLCVAVGDVCQHRCVAWGRVDIRLLRSFSGHSNHHRDPLGQAQRAPLQCLRTACRTHVDDYPHLSVLCLVAAFLPYKFGFRRALYLSPPLRRLSFIGERVEARAFRLLLDCLCGGRCIDVCHRSSQCPT